MNFYTTPGYLIYQLNSVGFNSVQTLKKPALKVRNRTNGFLFLVEKTKGQSFYEIH